MNVWDLWPPSAEHHFGIAWYASTFTCLFLTIYLIIAIVIVRFVNLMAGVCRQWVNSRFTAIIGSINSADKLAFYRADYAVLVLFCFRCFKLPNNICLGSFETIAACLSIPGTLSTHCNSVPSFLFTDIWPFLEIPLIYLLNNYNAFICSFKRHSYTDLFTQYGFDFIVNLLTGGDCLWQTTIGETNDDLWLIIDPMPPIFINLVAIFLFSKGFQVSLRRRRLIWQK